MEEFNKIQEQIPWKNYISPYKGGKKSLQFYLRTLDFPSKYVDSKITIQTIVH